MIRDEVAEDITDTRRQGGASGGDRRVRAAAAPDPSHISLDRSTRSPSQRLTFEIHQSGALHLLPPERGLLGRANRTDCVRVCVRTGNTERAMEWSRQPSYQVASILNLQHEELLQRQQQQQHPYRQQHVDDEEQTQQCKREYEEYPQGTASSLSRSDSGSFFSDRFSTNNGGFMSSPVPTPLSQYCHQQQQDASSYGFEAAPQTPLQASASMTMEVLTNAHFSSMHALDLQHFDESASVDLQQLFPSPAALPSTAAVGAMTPLISMQTLQQTPSTEFFSESTSMYLLQCVALSQLVHSACLSPSGFHPYRADFSQGGMPSFSFSTNPQQLPMFDDREELGGMSEMHEVSNLFGSASLLTPPTSIITPRTSIVSPMNGGFLPPRNAAAAGHTPTNSSTASAVMREGSDGMAIETSPKFSPDRRKLCCIEGCKSQARAFNRCKRHGGSKRCSHPGCTKSVQSRGLCIRHGGGSRCQEHGCTRAAQSHGRCKMHGGGRPCIVAGCEKKAHLKRLCRKHGGGAKCSLETCDKWAQRQGMCMTHSKRASPMVSSGARSATETTSLARVKKTASAASDDAMKMATQL